MTPEEEKGEERKRSVDRMMAIRVNVVALKSELHDLGIMDLDKAVDEQADMQIHGVIWDYFADRGDEQEK